MNNHQLNRRRKREEERVRELSRLPAGAAVEVLTDTGIKVKTRIKERPWQLGHGQWVVGLVGISGGFDVLRVSPVNAERKVEQEQTERTEVGA